MTTTTKIENFPASKIDDARCALGKAWARLCRAADKSGQYVPGKAPELVVVAERVRSRCRACKTTIDGFPPENHRCFSALTHAEEHGSWVSVQLADVEVTAASPKLAGWEFLACVEPLDGGNLIRQVPGAKVEDGELLRWRDGTIGCDHCRAARWRKETFIVRADGTGIAADGTTIPAGTYKQVGRNCIQAFLGGRSAASIVAMLGWPDVVRAAAGDEDDGGGWFGRSAPVYDQVAFLTWVAASIREDGWVSRSAARAYADASGGAGSRRPTADHAMYLMTPPFGGDDAMARWKRDRTRCAPGDVERERAAAALEWARTLPETSDYERNLALVARQSNLDPKHAGILASAVSGHARALGREMERKQRNAMNPSAHVGTVGARIGMDLLVERKIETATDYGALNIIIMRDASNNLLVWKTGSISPDPGDRLRLRGTVKKHVEYKGQKQTELSRCDVLETIAASTGTTGFDQIASMPPSDKPSRAKRARKSDDQSDRLSIMDEQRQDDRDAWIARSAQVQS